MTNITTLLLYNQAKGHKLTNCEVRTLARLYAPDGKKNLIGPRVRELRRARGLSQEQLMAQLQILGMDSERGVVKRIENGTRFVSDVELCLLADYFQVSVSALLGRE